jgi:hypothetical protein
MIFHSCDTVCIGDVVIGMADNTITHTGFYIERDSMNARADLFCRLLETISGYVPDLPTRRPVLRDFEALTRWLSDPGAIQAA